MRQYLVILLLSLCSLAAYSSPPLSVSPAKAAVASVSQSHRVAQSVQPSQFAVELVTTMRRYIGERETSVNSSTNIDRWAKLAGVPLRSYWCATFTYGTAEETEQTTGIENPLPRTGSVSRMLAYSASYGSGLSVIKVPKYGSPELITGDIGCMKSGRRYGDSDIGSLWNGHQYTVQYQRSDSEVRSIEGNTNTGGSRNGDKVAERWRHPRDAVAYIRIPERG
ncbi:MAG: hypothetical protein JNL32_06435 [Candidatus Kapabacteria bacterium]|nr:hypothetical protein [Candidatus Kapabacteria bacterium]